MPFVRQQRVKFGQIVVARGNAAIGVASACGRPAIELRWAGGAPGGKHTHPKALGKATHFAANCAIAQDTDCAATQLGGHEQVALFAARPVGARLQALGLGQAVRQQAQRQGDWRVHQEAFQFR